MRYASVCDGIGAVHVAWRELGWECAWTSEIEPYPAAVVEHHFGFPNLGDMTRITNEQIEQHGAIDLLVGGTPCQSFSVAGLRKGLADPRGNLALEFLRLADATRARWVVWENVPGVLSSNGGRDFGAFLGGLVELGYGFAYRVLDAQYFGLAQRRERVFVVGCLGDWRGSAAVLFERSCLSGHPASGGKEGERVGRIFPCFTRRGPGSLREEEAYIVEPCGGVRHMTPREMERGMGFPDDYTLIPYRGKPAADGPRYKAIGNSMARLVMRWIGQRIQDVEVMRQ